LFKRYRQREVERLIKLLDDTYFKDLGIDHLEYPVKVGILGSFALLIIIIVWKLLSLYLCRKAKVEAKKDTKKEKKDKIE
jgi:hypothetical protein